MRVLWIATADTDAHIVLPNAIAYELSQGRRDSQRTHRPWNFRRCALGCLCANAADYARQYYFIDGAGRGIGPDWRVARPQSAARCSRRQVACRTEAIDAGTLERARLI